MTTKHGFEHPEPGGAITSEFAGDPDMVELVKLFVDEMPTRIDALLDSWQRGAAGDLRRIAHQMKGACGGYGFPQVGNAAGVLERSLAAFGQSVDVGELERLRNQVDDLVDLCRRVSAEPGPGN